MWGGGRQYGYLTKENTFRVVPEEAKVVKRIFELYLKGEGMYRIAKILNNEGIKPLNCDLWNDKTIKSMLSNINYTGDIVLQKTFRTDYLSKRKKINNGERNKYYVEDDHEQIIDKETFNKVSLLLKKKVGKGTKTIANQRHKFTGLLKCGTCGEPFRYKENKYQPYYICNKYDKKGKKYCDSKRIREDVLENIVYKSLGINCFDEELIRLKIRAIVVFVETVNILFKDGTETKYEWKTPSRSLSWNEEMKEKARIKSNNYLRGIANA